MQNIIPISAGQLFTTLKTFLTSNIRFGTYTLDEPDSDAIKSITLPSGNIEYQEPRTGALFPIENLKVLINDDLSKVRSCATFSFQILMRFSGNNSYEQLTPALETAHNIVTDTLLVMAFNPGQIDSSIISVDSVEHDPVAVMRLDGAVKGDWIIAVVPKFKITWISAYSDCVVIDLPGGGTGGGTGGGNGNPGGGTNPPQYNINSGVYIADPDFFLSRDEQLRNKELDLTYLIDD